jgi:hypothetical protein
MQKKMDTIDFPLSFVVCCGFSGFHWVVGRDWVRTGVPIELSAIL